MVTTDLKEELILFFQHCGTQCGKSVFIKEYITTRQNNYDRHCTTYSNFDFKLESFGVRTSGAKATFSGIKFSYEISVGNLISFEKKRTGRIPFSRKL